MEKKYKTCFLLMFLLFIASIAGVMAQPGRGGLPPSFQTSLADENQPFLVQPPDVQALLAEDEQYVNFAPRVAVILPVDLNPSNSGEWITLETGETIWRLAIEAEGAKAITLFYSNFKLPKGSKLFIYNKTKNHVIGAFNEENNPIYGSEFATEFIAGDHIVLEYVSPLFERSMQNVVSPVIQIEGIGYAYNDFISVTEVFNTEKGPAQLGMSGLCMVNINCPEGTLWQNQKKGVAATIQRIGNASYICSGTLLNNIREDLMPYFLMAWHCSEFNGNLSSAADFNQYQFYFHWERAGCDNATPPIEYKTMIGCQFQTESPLTNGSDGLLLLLNQAIPNEYDVYFNGWDATLPTSWQSGNCIHHPSGDVKKIATAAGTITQAIMNPPPGGMGAPNGFWTCIFNPTAVEGGSSGSPLFNAAGNVIGTFTGGNSSCSNVNGSNLFGKMGYHFDKLGTLPVMKLFLDPDNTGARVCPGRYAGDEPIANFTALTRTPYAVQPVQFYSQSYNAISYYWEFSGGTPETSTEVNPVVTYMAPGGPHDVTLTINDGEVSKTKTGYITVTEKMNEQIIEIGTGTYSDYYPLGVASNEVLGYGRCFTATLYTAEQLGDSAQIRSIAWNANNKVAYERRIRVWMEHTDATDVSAVTAWNYNSTPNTTATLVLDYENQTNRVGWNTWKFNQNEFNYNGTQNIIVYVEVGFTQNSSIIVNMNPLILSTSSGINTNKFWQSRFNENPSGTGTTNNSCPNIRLVKAYPSIPTVANYTGLLKFFPTSDFREDFEGDFPPTTGTYGAWTTINTHPENAWAKGNPQNGPAFSTIDPTSQYSAIIQYQNTQYLVNGLITPEIDIALDNRFIQFYAYYDLINNAGAHLQFTIATEAGNFTNWDLLWRQSKIVSGAPPAWYKICIDLSDFIGQNVKLAWWAIGTNGSWMGIDGVVMGSAPLEIFEIYKDELLELTDLSTGPPVVWDWEFPGSTTPIVQSFDAVPRVQYQYAGTYDLGLTTTNIYNSDSKYRAEQLIVQNRAPKASFSAKGGYNAIGSDIEKYHPFIPPGQTVNYTNLSKHLPDVNHWTFEGGDPETSTMKDVITTYNTSGIYTTILKAKNVEGESSYTKNDLVRVGYGPENITNFDIPGGKPNFNAVPPSFLGGSGMGTQIAERYEGPPVSGKISGVLAYVGGKGNGSRAYTLDILLPGSTGYPNGELLKRLDFNINQLPTGNYPQLVNFEFDEPVIIPAGQKFFVRVTNFTSYAASTYLHFIVSQGDPIPYYDLQGSSAYVLYQNNWFKVSDLLVGAPSASMALWPQFTYTQLDVNTQLTLPAEAGEKFVPVTTNTTYTINSNDTWYNLSVGSNGVTVSYQANNTGAAREGEFTVSGGGVTKTVTVLQATEPLTLSVTPKKLLLPCEAAMETFEITSNVQWTAACSEQWVHIANPTGVNNATFNFNVAANMTHEARKAIMTITGGGIAKIVQIAQSGSDPYLEIEPEGTIYVHKLDGYRNINVAANTYWFATANEPWINFSKQTGNGNDFAYFNFNANPTTEERTAVITVNAGSLSATLTVIQAAGDGIFAMNPNTLHLSYTGGMQEVTLISPASWSAEAPNNDWYTIAPTSGFEGTETITVTCVANNDPVNRGSTVTFENGSFYRYLQIYQKGIAAVSWNNPVNGTFQVLYGTTPVSNGDSFELGTELTVVATPDPEYKVSTLTLNGAPFINNGSFLVTGTSVINIQFDDLEDYSPYIIIFGPGQSQQAGGYVYPTLFPETNLYVFVDPATVSFPFSIVPNEGYYIDKVYVDDVLNPEAVQTGTYTFTNIADDHTIFASFVKMKYVITTLCGAHGTITPENPEVVHGATQTFNFIPNVGYKIHQVFIDDVEKPDAALAGAYTFLNVTAPHTVSVTFAQITFTIAASATSGGAIQPNGTVTIPYGSSQLFNFTAEQGYDLVSVLIDGENDPAAVAVGSYLFTNVLNNHTIAAQFEKRTYNIYLPEIQGIVITPVEGSTSPVEYGGSYKFTVDLEEGYNQSKITVRANGFIVTPAGNIYAINNISAHQTITIDGVNQNKYEITAHAYGGGTINPAGIFIVMHGHDKTFEMIPNTGYRISDVVVNGESMGAVVSYTFNDVKANNVIRAYFIYGQSVGENDVTSINIFSHKNVVTIINEQHIPIQQVDIMDIYGRIVWTGEAFAEKTEITLNIASGLYTIRINTEDNQYITAKIVIN